MTVPAVVSQSLMAIASADNDVSAELEVTDSSVDGHSRQVGGVAVAPVLLVRSLPRLALPVVVRRRLVPSLAHHRRDARRRRRRRLPRRRIQRLDVWRARHGAAVVAVDA